MKTETRTDIHRPSAPEFNPEDYDCIGVFDLTPGDVLGAIAENARRMATVNMMIGKGYKFSSVHSNSQCGHCGASIRYAALMAHVPTKGMIYVGETCLGNRFSLTKGEFQTLRKNAALNRDRMKKSAKVSAVIEAMSSEVLAAYSWATAEGFSGSYVAQDIARKVVMFASPLSPKQEAFLVKLHTESLRRELEKKLRAEKIEAGEIEKCPEGRVAISGKVLSVKWIDNDFGGCYKMTVESEKGFRLYGSVPSSLLDVQRGQLVTFSAKVEPSKDDPCFGFYSRPTKASIIQPAD